MAAVADGGVGGEKAWWQRAMSYDVCLFRMPDGVDPAPAYAELMERGDQELAVSNEMRRVISPAGAAQLERVEQ